MNLFDLNFGLNYQKNIDFYLVFLYKTTKEHASFNFYK